MAKVNVDPAELRRFARDLNTFNQEMQTLLGGLNSKLRGLEETWRDQEQRKFAEQFNHTVKSVSTFMNSSQEYVAFLNKKAAHVESYLKQR